jgi:hypothetical protein
MRWQGATRRWQVLSEARFSVDSLVNDITLQVYCMYDTVAKQNSNPFVANNDAAALRELDRMCKRDGSDASEYEIWHLGIWKPAECDLRRSEQPKKVSRPIPSASLKAV